MKNNYDKLEVGVKGGAIFDNTPRLRHRSRERKVPSSSPAWTSVLR